MSSTTSSSSTTTSGSSSTAGSASAGSSEASWVDRSASMTSDVASLDWAAG